MRGKKWNKLWETIGKAFFELGKLTFAGLVIGALLKGGLELIQAFVYGLAAPVVFFCRGDFFFFTVRNNV